MDQYELLAEGFEIIESAIAKNRGLSESMNKLIRFCEKNFKHKDWKKFKEIDFEETDQIEEWLENLLSEHPIPENVKALWFGIYNPINALGDVTTDLYLVGSTKFDPKDEYPEWPSRPKYKVDIQSESSILEQVYQISYDESGDGLENISDYLLSLGYTALSLKKIFSNKQFVMANHLKEDLALFVGFDDGDIIMLQNISDLAIA